MCEVQAGRRPRVLATDVILDIGTSLKVIWKSQLRLIETLVVRILRISGSIV
jgi:hypothetical protein